MASNNTTSVKEVPQGPKPEDLDIIANVMDTILINMKSEVQNCKKNKSNDISSNSAFPNLTSEIQKGMMSDIQKHVEIPETSNKNMKPPPISENDEANSKDQKNVNSTKSEAHSAVQNTPKKTVSNKKDEITKSSICNDVQNKKDEITKSSICNDVQNKKAEITKSSICNDVQNKKDEITKSSICNDVQNKKDEITKSSICNDVQNKKRKQNNEKSSPKKMQVVNKENDKLVSKSLNTMVKQNKAPKISTVPIVNTKPIADNKRNIKSCSPSITDNMNITRNAKTISLSSKTGNITCQSIRSNANKIDILRDKNFKSGNEIKSDKKQLGKSSLYVAPKEFMEKQIHRNSNMLRPISQCEPSPCSRITTNHKRTISLNTKSCPNKKFATGTHNKNIQNQNVNNKRPAQDNSKSQCEVRKPQNTNTDIRSTFQNEKKLNDDKENQIPGPSTSQPNKSMPLDTNPKIKTIPPKESSISSTPSNLKQTAPLKFIKNNEKPGIKKVNDKGPATIETQIKESKIENKVMKIEDNTQSDDESKLNEMGDCTVELINEKIQDIIDKIKDEKDNSKLNSSKTSSTNATSISQQPEKKEKKFANKKPLITTTKLMSDTNNNLKKFNSKRNVKTEQVANTKKSSSNNQQKASTSVAVISKGVSKTSAKSSSSNNQQKACTSAAVISKGVSKTSAQSSSSNNQQKACTSVSIISKGVSKTSAQSCVVPKSNNVLDLLPSRKLSTLNPMEIVQDFVKLVSRAKRERKTFTVCGNYYSVRRAFTDRGWIEKLRINLTDDKESWRKLDTLTNFELVEGIKDKQNGEKYRRVFISKLLAGHQVDFYWDYMTNPFNVNNDKVKRTIINRFPFGSTRSYTSKAGLCESLKDAHWFFIEGHSNILFPRTYNLSYEEDINSFIDDFRLTAVISLLKWISKYSDTPALIMSHSGQVPTSVFNFATLQCYNYIKIKEHKDIDDIIPMTKEYEWDIFLEKFYKIIHQGAHFKENDSITAPLIIDQARYILNKMQKYLPRIANEGNMNLWLLKPNNGSRGCGIHVCRTLKYTLDMVSTRKEMKYVIQKYIERPLLIHNTKFDIRQWFLVTCMPNLHIWLYKDCYLRFSSQMYDLSKLHESIHLTNNSIQCRYKNNANRNAALPDQNMWHSDTFRKYLTDIGQPYAWKNIIYKGIKECLVGLFMLCQDRLLTRVNSFELCGADFMLTEDFRPYLIEINSRPALYPSTKVTATMCPKVLEDVVRVTVDYARNPRAGTGNFELIYKDTYSYVPPKNVSNLFIDGISYVKYATATTKKKVKTPTDKYRVKSLEETTGSIEKILKIDPTKVRKDVKNTLEKILAIIHSEQNKSDGTGISDDKSKQFRMMLSDFVDIISSVKEKQKNSSR